jgi:hypothetical protein
VTRKNTPLGQPSKRRTTLALPAGEQALNSYRTAFGGFSEEEMAILDGVILEQEAGPNPAKSAWPDDVSMR